MLQQDIKFVVKPEYVFGEEYTAAIKAIIYARVSSDKQAEEGTSLDNQVKQSLAYAERLSAQREIQVQIVGIFRDDFPGTTLDRPELNKVRSMLKSGDADTLIVYKTNRQDRSWAGVNYLLFLQELKQLGVSFHKSETGREIDLNDDSQVLIEAIEGWQAGKDHKDTVNKLYDGRVNKSKKKFRGGRGCVFSGHLAPYGYKLIKVKVDGYTFKTFEIDDKEAETVKLIFKWYVTDGMSMSKIADRLNELEIPPRAATNKFYKKNNDRPTIWYLSTISAILRNKTYLGTWHYAKRSKRGTDPIPVEVPPIIDADLVKAAHDRIKHNKRYARRNRKSNRYLLAQRVQCGDCGYKMHGATAKGAKRDYHYYRCPSRGSSKQHRRGCNLPHFNADKVDEIVWDWLTEIVHDQDKLEKGLRGYQEATRQKATPIKNELAHIEKLLIEYNDEWSEAMTNMEAVTSRRAKAKYALDIERIESTLDELEHKKARLEAELNAKSITDEEILEIKQFIAMIADDWQVISQNTETKRRLIQWLDIQCRLTTEDGRQVIYVTGKIAPNGQSLPVDSKASRSVLSTKMRMPSTKMIGRGSTNLIWFRRTYSVKS